MLSAMNASTTVFFLFTRETKKKTLRFVLNSLSIAFPFSISFHFILFAYSIFGYAIHVTSQHLILESYGNNVLLYHHGITLYFVLSVYTHQERLHWIH